MTRGLPLLLFFLGLLACGSKTGTDTTPDAGSDASTTTTPASSACHPKPGDVGNCFSNVTVDSAEACGFTNGQTTLPSAQCIAACGNDVKCCSLTNATTIRCEQCSCP